MVSVRRWEKLIDSGLEEIIQNPVMDERRRILNWISKFNYWKDQVDYFARAGEGTGQWFLDSVEFKSWIEGEKRFLWCRGGRKSHPSS